MKLGKYPTLILIDTCIFIYVVGRKHPLRDSCRAAYRKIIANPADYNIDTEVLQEILHLYHSRRETERGIDMTRSLLGLFPGPIPITSREIEVAAVLLAQVPRLSARDAIHATVAKVHGATAIMSVDRDFDAVPGLQRLDPVSEIF